MRSLAVELHALLAAAFPQAGRLRLQRHTPLPARLGAPVPVWGSPSGWPAEWPGCRTKGVLERRACAACLPAGSPAVLLTPPHVVAPACRGVQIAAELKKSSGPKLKDFREALEREEPAALGALRRDVEDFAKQARAAGQRRQRSQRASTRSVPAVCAGLAPRRRPALPMRSGPLPRFAACPRFRFPPFRSLLRDAASRLLALPLLSAPECLARPFTRMPPPHPTPPPRLPAVPHRGL